MASTTSQMASRATHAARGGGVGRFYRKRFPYILALPILLYEGVFLLYPMACGALLSFSDVQMGSGGNWVGLDNYRRMFGDAIFWQVILNTIVFSASVIVIALLVGLGIALLMNRSLLRARHRPRRDDHAVGLPGRAHRAHLPVDHEPRLRRPGCLRAVGALGP